MESSIMSCVCISPRWRGESARGFTDTARVNLHALHTEHQALAAHTHTKREGMSKDPTQLCADLISPPGNAAALATGLKNAMFLKKHGTFWILCCGSCGPAF